ncbi:MAG: O-antigen ligase family protein [Caldilineales bacterium]
MTVSAVVGLLAVFIWRAAVTHTFLPPSAVDWPNVLALLLLPVGLWASHDPAASWPAITKVIAGFGLFYGLAGLGSSRWTDSLPWLFLSATALASLVVLFGTRWFTAKLPFVPQLVYDLLPEIRLPWRTEGIHPNLAGAAMAWLILPALAMAIWGRERPLRLVAVITSILAGLALLLTQSRGAWMGVAAALVVIPTLRYRRWWLVVILVAAACVAGLVLFGPALLNSLMASSGGEDTAINTLPGRLEIWVRAIYLIRDSGLTGAGPGLFEPVVMALYPPFFTGIEGGFIHAHNTYLQAAVDFGIAGLVAQIALMVGLGAGLVAATRRIPDSEANSGRLLTLHSMAVGLFGSLIVMAVHGLVEASLAAPRGYVLAFVLFGAAAALSNYLLHLPGGSHQVIHQEAA